MRTLRILLALLALALGVSTGRAQSFTVPMTGGGSGSVTTGSVTALVPLVLSGTEMQLPQSISQLNTNRAFTNANMVFSNMIVVNATANALTNGILMTNAVKYAGTLATAARPMLVWMTTGEYYTPTNTLPSVMMAVDNVSTYWAPGAVWMSGRSDANGDTAFMWDDTSGKRTNVNVYGHGNFYLTNHDAAVVSIENGSKMTFQARNAYASDGTNSGGGAASVFNFLGSGGAADFQGEIYDTIYCDTYDALFFSAEERHKVRIKARRIASKFGDILETTGTAANLGDIVVEADLMERTATTEETLYGATYRPQPSFLKVGGNIVIRAKAINCYSTNGVIYSGNTTNYSIIMDAVITVATNSVTGILGDGSGTGNAQTGLRFKNCTLIGPWALDPINLTNMAALPTIFENCTIQPGASATNWVRGITPSSVLVLGTLAINPWKPASANITLLGTNTTTAQRILGNAMISGSINASNSLTVDGDIVSKSDFYGVGAGYFNALTITNIFYVPFLYSGAAADGAGSIHQRSNAWATGRGTLIFNDQTADVLAVATLASDTPSNGQVPVWNTGGTITWEAQSGSGSTQMVTAAIGTLTVTNGMTVVGSTSPGELQLNGTNGVGVVVRAPKDTIAVTNNMNGLTRVGTNNLMLDMNYIGRFTITNKFDFAASITFSNCAEGQEYLGILSGGGTSRVITFRADTNSIFADLDAFGVARATTKTVTLTNANDMEVSAYVTRPLGNAFGTTNVINLITRQYAQ